MKVVLAHGLEGHPEGTKASHLRAGGVELIAPDCRKRSLADRIERVAEALDAHPGALLVGSSYGGLVAAWLATQRALPGLVLCAPALQWVEAPVTDPERLCIPSTTPTTVIHGTRDEVVPIAGSRLLKARCPHIQLIEVDDDHRLGASLDDLMAAVRRFTG